MKSRVTALVVLAAGVVSVAAGAEPLWRSLAPLPTARTEVTAAVVGSEIAVIGGFLADGSDSREVDLYSPARDTWRRAAALPVGVNHAMAATLAGKLVLVGGYAGGTASRSGYMLEGGRWKPLPKLPARRAAGGAVAVGGKLYVVGGVGPVGLARNVLVYDSRTKRWDAVPGPTPREHLAVAATGGRVYAIAGRTSGYDTNLDLVESWKPGETGWRRVAPVPGPRGGTGAVAAAGLIVSVGGEAPTGTIGTVYAYDLATGAWRRLPDLPTPRHGLGLVAIGGTVYAIGGGPEPGLHVSAANEALTLR